MPRRIYITRRKATGRHVANEAELLATLQPLGFVSVVAEELDWLHQIALFHHAECIVAPHGAGLANLVFASPPVLVVELIAEAYPFSFFPEISRQLDLRHRILFGAPLVPSQIRSTDLRVDPAAVLAVLEKELN
jgi:capsular polysaccharide biosynthesis protein